MPQGPAPHRPLLQRRGLAGSVHGSWGAACLGEHATDPSHRCHLQRFGWNLGIIDLHVCEGCHGKGHRYFLLDIYVWSVLCTAPQELLGDDTSPNDLTMQRLKSQPPRLGVPRSVADATFSCLETSRCLWHIGHIVHAARKSLV